MLITVSPVQLLQPRASLRGSKRGGKRVPPELLLLLQHGALLPLTLEMDL